MVIVKPPQRINRQAQSQPSLSYRLAGSRFWNHLDSIMNNWLLKKMVGGRLSLWFQRATCFSINRLFRSSQIISISRGMAGKLQLIIVNKIQQQCYQFMRQKQITRMLVIFCHRHRWIIIWFNDRWGVRHSLLSLI